MEKNWLIVGLAVAAAIFATLYFSAPAPQPPLMGFPGPEILSDYLILNGTEHRYYVSGLNNASTTLCSFQTPNATSTMVHASIKRTTGTSTAYFLEIAKAAFQTGTTTSLATRSAGPGLGVETLNGIVPTADWAFAPSQWLNFKYSIPLGADSAFVGVCKAEFIVY